MFYRAMVAAVDEGREGLAARWAEQLDRELPPTMQRSAFAILGDFKLQPSDIKAFCPSWLEG